MFFYEGYICPVCEKPFSPQDDIVACPQCGLPHHRSCWMREGHCHAELFHGTERQWSRQQSETASRKAPIEANEDKTVCSYCGEENLPYSEFCSRCGSPLSGSKWNEPSSDNSYNEYQPFSAFRKGESSSEPTENGAVSEREEEAVIGPRFDYYLPRFQKLKNGQSGGWNWAAFLFGPYWLMYRKMYGLGSLLLALQLILQAVTTFIMKALNIETMNELMSFLQAATLNQSQYFYFLSISSLSSVIWLSRLFLGGLGNRLYRYRCNKTVAKAKEQISDITPPELTARGGVSVAMVVVSGLAVYFLERIITFLLLG